MLGVSSVRGRSIQILVEEGFHCLHVNTHLYGDASNKPLEDSRKEHRNTSSNYTEHCLLTTDTICAYFYDSFPYLL